MADEDYKAARAAADGKLPLELLETAALHPTARVLAGGVAKYGHRRWRRDAISARAYVGAIRRHLDEWADGADADADSGEHPLAHISATCHVVLDALAYGTLIDDRQHAESKPEPILRMSGSLTAADFRVYAEEAVAPFDVTPLLRCCVRPGLPPNKGCFTRDGNWCSRGPLAACQADGSICDCKFRCVAD